MEVKLVKVVKDASIGTGYNTMTVKRGEVRKINFKTERHYAQLVKNGILTKPYVQLADEKPVTNNVNVHTADAFMVAKATSTIQIIKSPIDKILNEKIDELVGASK